MTIWPIIFIASTSFAAIGFVVVAVLWLKKLRTTISTALGETAGQQLRSSQNLHDRLENMQKQFQLYEDRLQTLTTANIHMRHELTKLASKDKTAEHEAEQQGTTRVLH